jgi:hypothetical protein
VILKTFTTPGKMFSGFRKFFTTQGKILSGFRNGFTERGVKSSGGMIACLTAGAKFLFSFTVLCFTIGTYL